MIRRRNVKRCECGCGGVITNRISKNREPTKDRYLRGHKLAHHFEILKNQQPPLCECGCGEEVDLGSDNVWLRYLLGHSMNKRENKKNLTQRMIGNTWRTGILHTEETKGKMSVSRKRYFENNPELLKDSFIGHGGYKFIKYPNHPKAIHGFVKEEWLVMESILGRQLLKTEVVHHRNENKLDNAPSNLELYSSDAEHTSYHTKKKWKEGVFRVKVHRNI